MGTIIAEVTGGPGKYPGIWICKDTANPYMLIATVEYVDEKLRVTGYREGVNHHAHVSYDYSCEQKKGRDNMVILTETGKKTVKWYIEELKAHRKEILDAGKDTADDTRLPTEEDIIADIEMWEGEDENYCNGWGVTDTYDHAPLSLEYNKDFIRK